MVDDDCSERDSSKKPVKLKSPDEACDQSIKKYSDKPEELKKLTEPKVVNVEDIECDCSKCQEPPPPPPSPPKPSPCEQRQQQQQQQHQPCDCGPYKVPERKEPEEKSLMSELFEAPKFYRIIGPKHIQIAKLFIPNACVFGVASFVALVYFTDWKPIARFIPFYNGKFKEE